jgi:hypothetical protein
VEIVPVYGETLARLPPDLIEPDVEQETTPVIQHPLPRDHAAAAPHRLIETEPPEHPDAIGGQVEPGADGLPLRGALHDIGGEPALLEGPSEGQPTEPAADDQDPQSRAPGTTWTPLPRS